MLKLDKCVIKQASASPISVEINNLEEGAILVAKMENGVAVAARSTGAADEDFIGVSQNRYAMPSSAILPGEATIPGSAPYTVNLGRMIKNTETGVMINGVAADVVTGSPAAGEVQISAAGVLTFASADAGKKISYLARYDLTQVEANLLFGSDLVSFSRLPDVQTSIIEVGLVVSDNYNADEDWANAQYAYAGPNGKLTTDDTGAKVGRVALLPSAADGFLGVEISV